MTNSNSAIEKSERYEAQRWLDTAAEDLGAARAMAGVGLHAHACFSAQQCAEKAVKALWRLTGATPRTSSIQRLIQQLPLKDRLAEANVLVEKAALLDRFYIPTRYPNGLPDLTPEQNYMAADSQQAVELADHFLQVLGGWIETRR